MGRQGEVLYGFVGQVKGLSFIFHAMEKSLKGVKQVLMMTLLLWEKSRNTGGLDQGANIEKLWCL